MKNDKVSVGIVSDGTFLLDGGAVFGLVPKTLWEPKQLQKYPKMDRKFTKLNIVLDPPTVSKRI